MDKKTEELIGELKLKGYFVSKVPPSASGKSFDVDFTKLRGSIYRFAVISCTQIGSKYQQMTHLNTFYRLCKRRGIELVLHCGDLVDGSKVYKGQEYELFLHGADEQVNYTVAHYPKIDGIKTKVILGNHDESFWKNDGYNVVKSICGKRADMEYLGDYLAYVNINGVKIAMMHGSGGVAYARSYKLQKIIEQFSPNVKPHMLFVGHWHVQCCVPQYRNVFGATLGAFQSQTPFLTRLGLSPDIGGLIVEVRTDISGILAVKTEWVPFYVPVKNDF